MKWILEKVLKNIQDKEEGKKASIDPKKATKEQLADYMAQILPNYDRDRVYPTDMKKLVQWYNILVENDITDFEEALQETPGDNIDDRQSAE